MIKTIQNADLRQRMRAQRLAISPVARATCAVDAAETLGARPEFKAADSIAGYLAWGGEFDVGAMLLNAWRAGKHCRVPVLCGSTMRFRTWSPDAAMQVNRFGISEPATVDDVDGAVIDLVLAPLLAFDDRGVRMGMGGGYYDRAFAFIRERPGRRQTLLVGVAFEAQRVAMLQRQPWDVPLDGVITEQGWTDFRKLEAK